MCGIAGIMRFDDKPVDIAILSKMTDILRHRGPDDEGSYISGPVGLGHRRLAIIDISSAGKQPMSNEDGTIWITYNGEIYNFLEMRLDLEKRGHCFQSATDTEVIIHAYEEWGTGCLKYLNGMFAFGLWDERRNRLWLVRDRLGIKPVFYCQLPQCLLFGSEIKAIICDPEVNRTIDYEALAYYLALNYMPAPHTLFAGIRQLLPGNYLIVDGAGKAKVVEYWDLTYQEGNTRSENTCIEEFSNLLEDSVRLRLVSDVPFGAFLSGGVDSSSVAYWMSHNMSESVKTFSIGFKESTFNELEHARLVAKSIQADHFERMVTADAATVLPKLVWHAEEPTADSSMVPLYYLAQLAREHVTMVHSGDGADEVLAGYETYQAYYLQRIYRFLPKWLCKHLIIPLVNALPVSDSKVSLDFKLRRFVSSAELLPEDAHATWRMIFNAKERERLLSPVLDRPGVRADVIDLYRAAFVRTNARHPLNRMLYVDTRLYLPNDMLVKVDRMTMAHGLEAREPYLDHRLVELAACLPPSLKIKYLRKSKYVLKASMRGKLPNQILLRKKEGFNVPNACWIKNEFKDFVMDHLSPDRVREMGVLDNQAVGTILRDHFAGIRDNSHQVWCLLTLVLWWQQFVEGKSLSC